LLRSLQRAAIMTSDKFKGVRWVIAPGSLKISSTNADQEEAVEELEIELAAEHLRQRSHRCPIGNAGGPQAAAGLVQLGRCQGGRRTVAVARFLAFRPHRLRQFSHSFPGRLGAHHEDEIALLKRSNGREILDRIVGKPLEIEQVRCMRRRYRRNQDRVTVRRRLRDCVGAERKDHAGPVLDDHRLACEFCQFIGVVARDDAAAAAGGKADHNSYFPCWKILHLGTAERGIPKAQ
ncbi:MAG: hypothetical protein J0I13_05135, partial [Rhizobiales bacterium]|nr:hypothetical protein [Hyphomicrobiales bacterium]